MKAVLKALAKAIGQLGDSAVLGVLAKSVGLTLLIFAGFGVVLYFALVWSFDAAGISDGGLASATAAVLIAGLAGWFLFRVVALAVLQFFADEIVAAVEQKHYPELAKTASALPFREDLKNSLRGIGRTIGVNLLALPLVIALLITGIGPALVLLGVNAWLLGRELTDMAWLRHCEGQAADNPVAKSQRFALGAAIAGIMLVPFANLIAPIIGAAAGTHLTQKAMAVRMNEGSNA